MLSWSSSAHTLEPLTRLAFMYSAQYTVLGPWSLVLGPLGNLTTAHYPYKWMSDCQLRLWRQQQWQEEYQKKKYEKWCEPNMKAATRERGGWGGELPAELPFFLLLVAFCQIFMLYLKVHKSRPYMGNMRAICSMVTLPMVIEFRVSLN